MLQPVGNICPLPIVEFGNGGMETMLTAASYDRQIPVHRRMTYEQMLQAVEPCSVHVTEGVLPGDVSGVYDESVSTIVIDGSMTDVQKRCALVHELLHWLHADDSCAGVGKTHEEVRVCRETAMMLVAPDAYIRAGRSMTTRVPLRLASILHLRTHSAIALPYGGLQNTVSPPPIRE